jgi:hypothetical protein
MDELQKALALHLYEQIGGSPEHYEVGEYDPETCTTQWVDVGETNFALIASSAIAFIDGWRARHGK